MPLAERGKSQSPAYMRRANTADSIMRLLYATCQLDPKVAWWRKQGRRFFQCRGTAPPKPLSVSLHLSQQLATNAIKPYLCPPAPRGAYLQGVGIHSQIDDRPPGRPGLLDREFLATLYSGNFLGPSG